MENRFKVTLLTFIIVLTGTFGFAQQNFQGKAYYQSKTTIDMSNFGRRDMPEERKKMIMERMKSALDKTYQLTFNASESIFREEEKLEAPGQGGGGRFAMMMSNFSSGDHYKNVKSGVLIEAKEVYGKKFLIIDTLNNLTWKLENETKKIGNYTCFKATTIKQVDELDFRNMRRPRKGQDERNGEVVNNSIAKERPQRMEMPKEIEVTAWYTLDIPVNQGPGAFWGLPGLILEVNTDNTTILCTKIVMNPEEKTTIKAPSKGKKVSRAEYNDIAKKKMKEMREMFRNRRGGGQGRGGRRG